MQQPPQPGTSAQLAQIAPPLSGEDRAVGEQLDSSTDTDTLAFLPAVT